MISAVDLLKGIAIGAGMDCVCVEGANGGLGTTNYKGKALAAVQALTEDGYDFAYIHVEAPDEMGHQGSAAHKIEAIEHVDKEVLGTVAEKLNQAGEGLSTSFASRSPDTDRSSDPYGRSRTISSV